MATRRIERLNEQLRRELADLLNTRVRDPRVLGVTVTAVRTSSDLTFAHVLVRIAGDASQRAEALAGLEAASPYLRRSLGGTLRIRRVPELGFKVDEALERVARIDELLDQVRPEAGWVAEDEEDDEDEEDATPGDDEP